MHARGITEKRVKSRKHREIRTHCPSSPMSINHRLASPFLSHTLFTVEFSYAYFLLWNLCITSSTFTSLSLYSHHCHYLTLLCIYIQLYLHVFHQLLYTLYTVVTVSFVVSELWASFIIVSHNYQRLEIKKKKILSILLSLMGCAE